MVTCVTLTQKKFQNIDFSLDEQTGKLRKLYVVKTKLLMIEML